MTHRDVYQEITNQIITELETGTAPWVKPWSSPRGFTEMPHNAGSGHVYRGVNVLLLWVSCAARGYDLPGFVTFKQAKAAGGHVRKGEKGFRVVYWSTFEKKERDNAGHEQVETIPFCKAYTVFNIEQCEGLPVEWYQKPEPRPAVLIDDDFNRFTAATGAEIKIKGDKAFYAPGPDMIQMPHALDFTEYSGWQATLLHELGHWTGHKARLDRDMTGRFKTRAYAAEELVAELTAAFLCAHLGIKGELRHAAYIESWLELLRNDKRAIFTAAARAGDAADHLRAYSDAEELDNVA